MSQQKKTPEIMYSEFFEEESLLWLLTVTAKNISNKKEVQSTKKYIIL